MDIIIIDYKLSQFAAQNTSTTSNSTMQKTPTVDFDLLLSFRWFWSSLLLQVILTFIKFA